MKKELVLWAGGVCDDACVCVCNVQKEAKDDDESTRVYVIHKSWFCI